MFGFYSYPGRKRPVFFCAALLAACGILGTPQLYAQNASLPPGHADEQAAPLPRTSLQIGEHRIVAEVAADEASRSKGLMFREELEADHGMLFMFPEASQMCFWMKNTLLPLTVAFIDAKGSIISLADMRPQSLETHCAVAPALYALEMEQGWFARHGAGPGSQVGNLPRFVTDPAR